MLPIFAEKMIKTQVYQDAGVASQSTGKSRRKLATTGARRCRRRWRDGSRTPRSTASGNFLAAPLCSSRPRARRPPCPHRARPGESGPEIHRRRVPSVRRGQLLERAILGKILVQVLLETDVVRLLDLRWARSERVLLEGGLSLRAQWAGAEIVCPVLAVGHGEAENGVLFRISRNTRADGVSSDQLPRPFAAAGWRCTGSIGWRHPAGRRPVAGRQKLVCTRCHGPLAGRRPAAVRQPAAIDHSFRLAAWSRLFRVIAGRTLLQQAVKQEGVEKRICPASMPTLEKGLTSIQRTSMYSIPRRCRAVGGVSPGRVTRWGESGCKTRFRSAAGCHSAAGSHKFWPRRMSR